MNSTLSLPEIGKRLATGVTQKEALLKLLKSCASSLQEVQQSAGPGTTSAIRPCVEAIVRPVYLKHRDKDVRLFAALCCSEALRVFAPEPPYTDPQLKDIFELVVEIFHRLNEVQNPLFNRIVGILETLAKVKTCIVMLDLELDQLVLNMFEVFFSTISQEHPQNVNAAMLDIMATILEEIEEVPQLLLDAILVNLLGRRKEQSPAAFALAISLVQRCADRLQLSVQRLFTTIMQDPQAVESKISEEYHQVILEIYKTAPHILVAVLPHLLEELGIDDVQKRLKAVTMLGKLFSIPEQHADQDYRQLHLEYMGRFVDKSMDIRLKMLELSQTYLLNTSSSGQDHFEAIAARLMDFEEKVRSQAVKVICTVAQAKPKLVPMLVLKQVAGRLRDKKLNVRRLTLPELSKVYRQYCMCLFEGKAISEDDFHWIPSSMLRCCFDKEVKEFRPQLMDLFLDEELFPNKLPIEDRVKNWISMYAVFEEIDIRALEAIFKNKSRIQQEMNKYLEVRQKLKEEGGSDLQNQVQVCFKNVATAFVDPGKAEEHLGKLQQLKDNNIFKALSTLLSPKTTYAQARACRDDLLKRVGEKHPQHEFIKHLATKISFTLFGEEHVSAVMKLMIDGKSANDNQILSASIKLLVKVSAHFSILFGPVQEDLMKLLIEGDESLKEDIAHILANTGVYMRNIPAEQASLISETLQRLALEGTRRQAKHAVLAIAAISEDSGLRDLSVLYTRVVDALGSSENLPTMFQTLGVIAQHSIPIFETREDDIVKFIMRNVLKRASDAVVSDEKEQKFEWDKPSEICHLKICGLKVLVKSFLPFKQTSHRAKLKGLLNVIQKLVPQGELGEDLACKSKAVDRAHIRLAASNAVLQLSRRYDHYIQSDFPDLLLPTLLLAQDPCLPVRQKFAAKVHEYLHLRENPLPTKFACTFVLQLVDVDKDSVSNSKRFLAEFVETSRRDAHVRQAKAAPGSTESSAVTFLPEYVLVYLVHVLAHHPDFPKSSDDPDKYEPFKVQMQGFIQAVLQLDGEGKSEQDPLPLIFAIFRTIKNIGEDAVNSERTERVFAVCDIGIMVAKDLGRKRFYSSEYAAAIPLPSSLYKAPSVPAEGQRKVDGSDLPKCLVEDSNKQKSKAAPLLKAVQASSTQGRKRGKSLNGDAAAEHHEGGDTGLGSKDERQFPKKARKERKLVSPVVLGDIATGGGKVNKEVSPARRSTPRKKALKSPENETKIGGEELIGRRIQVWWPIDKLFYYGRIQAYDPKKKQHSVMYDDGDVETLVLAKERWDLVDDVVQPAEEHLSPVLTPVSLGLPLPERTPESTETTLKAKDSSTAKQMPPGGRKGKSESQGSKRKREAGETDDSPNAKAGSLEHTPETGGAAAEKKNGSPVAGHGVAPLGTPSAQEGEADGAKATGGGAQDGESGAQNDPGAGMASGGSGQDPQGPLKASAVTESLAEGVREASDIAAESAKKEATETHTEVSLPTRRGGRGKSGERKKSAGNETKSAADADDDADHNGKAKRGRPKGSGKKDKKQAPMLQEETAEGVKQQLDREGVSLAEKDVLESKNNDTDHKEEGTSELGLPNGGAKVHNGGEEVNLEGGSIPGGDVFVGEGGGGGEGKAANGAEGEGQTSLNGEGGEEGPTSATDQADEPVETHRRRGRKGR